MGERIAKGKEKVRKEGEEGRQRGAK